MNVYQLDNNDHDKCFPYYDRWQRTKSEIRCNTTFTRKPSLEELFTVIYS